MRRELLVRAAMRTVAVRVNGCKEHMRRVGHAAQVHGEARTCARAHVELQGLCGELRHLARGEGERGDLDIAEEAQARHVVLDEARAVVAARCHQVGVNGPLVEVVQGLPTAAKHLARHRRAVLDRAPATRRPDLVELPHEDAELVLGAARLDVLLDVQRRREQALVQLPLEWHLARRVEVRVRVHAKVHVDQAVAWVVALRHHVHALALARKAALALIVRLTPMQRPVLGGESRRH